MSAVFSIFALNVVRFDVKSALSLVRFNTKVL